MLLPLGVVLLVLAAAYVRWPLSAHTTQAATWINMDHFQDDLGDYQLAWGRWRRGEVPLWNPYQLCGIPMVPTMQTGIFYPGNALYLLFATPRALLITAALHIALAGWFAGWYVGRQGIGPVGMGAAAVVAAFGANALQRFWFSSAMHCSPWIFACLIALDALLERPTARAAVALAAAYGMQFLAGWPQGCILTAYVLAARLAWRMLADRSAVKSSVRVGAYVVLAAALWACLVAVQLLPTLELLPQAIRNTGGLTPDAVEGNGLAYSPWGLLRDFVHARPTLRLKKPYIGAVGVVLLLAAFMNRPRRRETVFWALVFAGGACFAMGFATPLYAVFFNYLPTGKWFRDPSRFLYVTHTAAAVLCAFGAESAWRRLRSDTPVSRRSLLIGASVTTVLVALALNATQENAAALGFVAFGRWLHIVRPWWPGLAAVAAAATFSRWKPAPVMARAVVAVACAVWVADLFYANRNGHAVPTTANHQWVSPKLLGVPEQSSVAGPRMYMVGDWLDFELNAKWGALTGLPLVNDYEILHPARHSRFFHFAQHGTPAPQDLFTAGRTDLELDAAHPEFLDLLSVRWIAFRPLPLRAFWLTEWPGALPAGVVDRTTTASRERGILLAENGNALPRAYVVHQVESVQDEATALNRLAAPDFDPTRTVLVSETVQAGHPTTSGTSAQAAIVAYAPERVQVRVTSPAPGWLVLTDSWYPGWRATVNGHSSAVLRANVLVRAVAVPAGDSDVIFTFRSTTQRLGAALSVLGVLACGAAVLRRAQPATAV